MSKRSLFAAVAALIFALALTPVPAAAHCDTLDGPVVAAAKQALKSGDVTPVLKWVKPEAEPEIRALFTRTLKVRALSPEARELADTNFFENLVRIHRAGEGAPFTGLKPAGTAVEPGIALADRAVETASEEELVKSITAEVASGIRERFAEVRAKRAHADDSVAAGREYVRAYVEFIHYVEGLHESIAGAAHEGEAVAQANPHRD